ncbi:MAG: hypothetical protein ACLU70_14025 [Lachnospira sp.]
MKTIMKTFSSGTIAAITALAILIILTGVTVAGHTGVFNIFGNMVTVDNADYSGYNAAAAKTQDILAGEPVQILYDDTADRIYAGTDAEILSRISIIRDGNTENAQNAERVKVLYVKDKEENEIAYDETSRTVRFENPGLYVVRVSVKDSENRQTVADITIPVEEQ